MKVLMLVLHHYHVTFLFIFPIVLVPKSCICSFEMCVIKKEATLLYSTSRKPREIFSL